MSLPSVAKTWNITACQRSPFSTLGQTMGDVMYGLKTALVSTASGATGYTILWSCDGSTGPTNSSDHTDRITSSGTFQTRFGVAGGAQSWFIATDASGVQILVSYTGASGDIAYVSFSPGAHFALASPTTSRPTASDEQVILSGTSIIGSSLTGDRLWSVWVSSDAKMFRVAVARQGAWITGVPMWGVEIVTSTLAGGTTWSPPVWGFTYTPANMIGASQCGSVGSIGVNAGLALTSVGSASAVAGGCEMGGGTTTQSILATITALPALQDNQIILPLSCITLTTSSKGKLGNRIDWWLAGITNVVTLFAGDTLGANQFI